MNNKKKIVFSGFLALLGLAALMLGACGGGGEGGGGPGSPSIDGAAPAAVAMGAAPPIVQLTGSGFESGVIATFNGQQRTTAFVSSSEIDITLQTQDTATAGTYPIVATNPDARASNAFMFTVENTQPAIVGVSPTGMVASAAPVDLTISGSNFFPDATVNVTDGNGASYPVTVTVNSATSITAGVTIAVAPAGNYVNVVVVNPVPSVPSSPAIVGVAATSVSFSGMIQPMLTATCAIAGCHAGASPASGLNLSAGAAYSQLVNVMATECSNGIARVVPGNRLSTSSYLMAKVAGVDLCSGVRMPRSGGPLSAAQVQLLINWIAEGAPNN